MYKNPGLRELFAMLVNRAFSISNDTNARQACVEWLLDSGVRLAHLTRAQREDKIVRDWWSAKPSVLNQYEPRRLTRNV